MSDHGFGGGCDSSFGNDGRSDQFSPLGIWDSEDGGLRNFGMLIENRFDFTAVNVFSAGDDHVLQAVQDVKVALRILISDVAGTEHSISECHRVLLRVIQITAHNVGTADDELA